MNRTRWIALGAAAGAAGAAAGMAGTLLRYQKQKREAMARLLADSQIADTVCGKVEYAMRGCGPTVLISHGAGGGYDQGMLLARLVDGFQFIAPSRFGYLRSPLGDRTFQAQADAYAALLDALGIAQVAVMGVSIGGPSALQFALRYPDRCWGLVLVSAISQPPPPRSVRMEIFLHLLLQSDLLPWLLTKTAGDRLLAMDGIGLELRRDLAQDPTRSEIVRGIMESFPTSLRRPGMLNDVEQAADLTAYPLERIAAPTLVLHGTADPTVPFAHGEFSAQTIPGAKLVAIKGGGHLCFVTHNEETVPPLAKFLRFYTPTG
ncbi:MAG: alpha/beta hydrolase [Chloroflexi bacterium]|nr:alpha/beta hydrolase [Chloroflexota bacterium]